MNRFWSARRDQARRAFGTSENVEGTMSSQLTSETGSGKRRRSLVDLGLSSVGENAGLASDIGAINLKPTLVGLCHRPTQGA